MQRTSNLINPLEYVINRFKIDLLKSAYTFCEQTQSTTSDGTCLQGCHADDNGRTDGRTMAAGSSVTWTHCSVRYEVTWDKTLSSARTEWRPCGRAASTPWMPRDYIRVPQTFHSHFLHRLGLEKLRCVWCTSCSRLR
jgi:hypothetical protein